MTTPLRKVYDAVDKAMQEPTEPPAEQEVSTLAEYGPPILRAPKVTAALVSNAHEAAARECEAAGHALIEMAKREADAMFAMAHEIRETGNQQAESISRVCNTVASIHSTMERIRGDVVAQG